MIRDLNVRRQQVIDQLGEKSKKKAGEGRPIGGKDDQKAAENGKARIYHWNAYIGIMRQLRETHALLHKLLGLEKMTLEIGGDRIKGIHDLIDEGRHPTLPRDIPESARLSPSSADPV